jgi:hypothetical protein
MRALAFFLLAVAPLVAGCAEVQVAGHTAIQHRKLMNDLQAQATMLALCDLSIGSFFRQLTPEQRLLVARSCAGPVDLGQPAPPDPGPARPSVAHRYLPTRLKAGEPS